MTVSELITLLQSCRSEAHVVIHGYKGGYLDVGSIETQPLKLFVNTEWYYGPHEQPEHDQQADEIAYLISS